MAENIQGIEITAENLRNVVKVALESLGYTLASNTEPDEIVCGVKLPAFAMHQNLYLKFQIPQFDDLDKLPNDFESSVLVVVNFKSTIVKGTNTYKIPASGRPMGFKHIWKFNQNPAVSGAFTMDPDDGEVWLRASLSPYALVASPSSAYNEVKYIIDKVIAEWCAFWTISIPLMAAEQAGMDAFKDFINSLKDKLDEMEDDDGKEVNDGTEEKRD